MDSPTSNSSSIYTHALECFETSYACICGEATLPVDSAADLYVQCVSCQNWQHTICMGLVFQDISTEPYYCQICQIDVWQSSQGVPRSSSPISFAHAETLEAVGNGGKIWEERVGAFLALRRVLTGEESERGVDIPKLEKSAEQAKTDPQAGDGKAAVKEAENLMGTELTVAESGSGNVTERSVRRSQRKPKLASFARDQKWF